MQKLNAKIGIVGFLLVGAQGAFALPPIGLEPIRTDEKLEASYGGFVELDAPPKEFLTTRRCYVLERLDQSLATAGKLCRSFCESQDVRNSWMLYQVNSGEPQVCAQVYDSSPEAQDLRATGKSPVDTGVFFKKDHILECQCRFPKGA